MFSFNLVGLLKEVGMLPERKSVSAPIQIFCRNICLLPSKTGTAEKGGHGSAKKFVDARRGAEARRMIASIFLLRSCSGWYFSGKGSEPTH
jgi:hypothetical protein